MIIELPEKLAQQLSDTATEEGLDPTAYVRRLVERTLTANNFALSHPLPSPQEASSLSSDGLLKRINDGPTKSFWVQYRELAYKRDAETITPDELEELIRRSDTIEEWGAERLFYLMELAKRRGVHCSCAYG